VTLRETVNNAYSSWMEGTGPDADIVISSRVRVARNLSGFSFPYLLSEEKAEQVLHAVQLAIISKEVKNAVGNLELVRLNELQPIERQILVEKHLISPDLLEKKLNMRAVVLRDDEAISIMVNEEDHLRMQCLMPGLKLREAWRLIDKLDDAMESTLDFAFSERLGYLTACPTNVGTGLRASVMVHLPGLVLTNQIYNVLTAISKLGITVRGLYGEGTESKGNLFQVSNQITLGQTENEIVENLISITKKLLAQERSARQALLNERREFIEDKVCRAYGTLLQARIISSEEAMRLLSDVRLGVDMGIIKKVPSRVINELLVLIRPAYLIKISGREMTPYERDVKRAELIRRKLA